MNNKNKDVVKQDIKNGLPQERDVALFMDFENIYISVRDVYNQNPNFEYIMDRASEYGRLIVSRAYADWYRYQRITNALYANGIEPVYVPTYYYGQNPDNATTIKNSVDIHMVIDVMRMLYTHENINTFIIVTGDRDFIPLINAIRQRGKECIVVGVAEASSSHLAQSADEFIFYHQLADEIRPPISQLDPYDAVPEAVKLARKRENVPTFATIKLLLVEMLGEFDHRKLKGPNGRPYNKFKDFMKECERRGLIKIVTSGTVNEVFLPGEDTSKSAFGEPQQRNGDRGRKSSTRKQASPKTKSDSHGKVDPFDLLVEAVHEARRRDNLCTMATLKVLMKEIHPGFDESHFTNEEGESYAKFKELVEAAEERGLVQILTTGTVHEVFLPEEDPHELSRFASASSSDGGS